MTGRDTFRTGMQFEVIEDSAPWGLPLGEATLAERFKAAGYSTHMASRTSNEDRLTRLRQNQPVDPGANKITQRSSRNNENPG